MKMGILAKNPYHATNPPKNNPTYLPKPKFLTKKMFSCIIDLIKFIFYSITMKKLTRLFSLVTSFVLLFSSFWSAWQATIDTSFWDWETTDFFNIWSGFFNRVKALAVQDDGKIIVGWSFSLYDGEEIRHITRLNPDGSRDVLFMTGIGFEDQYYGYNVETLELQDDGKIIVGWSFTSYNWQEANNIIRLNNDGSIDNSFIIWSGFNSSNNGSVRKIILQDDGKILVWWNFTSYNGISVNWLVRLNFDGSIDSSFNVWETFNNVFWYPDLNTITIQNDWKILIGWKFETPINYYYCINRNQEEQPQHTTEESCLSAGYCYNKDWFIEWETEQSCIDNWNKRENLGFNWVQSVINNIARLNIDWSIDESFLPKNNLYKVNDINIQNNGKIIVWWFNETNMAAFNPFSVFADIAQNSNIFRLNQDWSIDNSFVTWEWFLKWYSTAIINKTIIQFDWKIIVIWDFSTYNWQWASSIARLNSDWSFDPYFNIWNWFVKSSRWNWIAYDIKPTNDWWFIVGGEFAFYDKNEANNIIKLNPDWSNNTNLNNNDIKWFNSAVYEIKTQEDGKTIIGWGFSSYNWQTANWLIRLNSNWSIDNSFDIWDGFGGWKNTASISTIWIQNDNKILVGGFFNNYNWQSANWLIRLNSNWSIDNSFDIWDGFDDWYWYAYITTIEIQDDGKILVGWEFSSYNWQSANWLIRLNSNWSIDNSFDIWDGFNDWFWDAYIMTTNIQDDGKILVGGFFNNYNWQTANWLIRLNPDWTIDSSFNVWLGFDDSVQSIAIQDDGKFLVGGFFNDYNWQTANWLIRLNSNWTIDNSFDVWVGFDDWYWDGYIMTTNIQDDGKILVGWRFTSYNRYYTNNILRLNPDWSIDNSFDVWNGFNNEVYKVEIWKEWWILIWWYFTFYNKEPTNYIASLIWNIPVYLPNSNELLDIKDEFSKKGYKYQNIDFWGDTFFWDSKISLKETNWKIFRSLNIITDAGLLSLPENLQFKKADNSNYIWNIYPPISHLISTVNNKPVISAISVGNKNESLYLTNWTANLAIPVSWYNSWDRVSIYSSQDNINWNFEKNWIISELEGQNVVSFATNHFTYFAITENVEWSFTINNDASTTASTEVTLNIDAPGATQMRFSNNWTNRSGWVAYSTTYPWTLSEGYENKTVYAQFDIGWEIFDVSDTIEYTNLLPWQMWGNITLTITWWITQCVYGTSLNLWSQDGNLWTEGYIFSGDFSPANRYCADYKWLSGWVFTIQTTDLINENWGVISGSNVFISHDVPVVQGHDSCTGHNWDETQFYGSPLSLIEKAEVANNDKICKVDISNVKLKVDVPAYQAPGDYIGTLTITLPNGFEN